VEAKWYKARNCYRVWVPARLSEKGKDCRRFFETKEQAEKFIFETKRSGSVELAELAVEEKHILGVIRQPQQYEPRLLLEAIRVGAVKPALHGRNRPRNKPPKPLQDAEEAMALVGCKQ
jgi:hypothetical protein